MAARHVSTAATRDQSWREQAECRPGNGHSPETFFPPTRKPYETRRESRSAKLLRLEQETKAKSICRACPVSLECYDEAIANREPEGVWGGTTAEERGITPLR